MGTNQWIYRISDGLLLLGESGDPNLINTDPGNYAIVDLGDDAPTPDPRTQRAASATTLRPATAQEIAAYDAAELDTAVKVHVDQERLTSAIVWCIIDTYSAPATPAKYQAARTKIITAYKTRPWSL